MCIIMVSPPGSVLLAEDLREAIAENRDGAGYMIRSNGRLTIERSADDDASLVERFIAMQEDNRNNWVVFHARLATHGSVTDDNCHPFTIPGQNWALAHNGICGLNDGPFSDRSDSRILAEDHIAHRTWQQLRDGTAAIEKWLGSDKVVILSARKERGGPCLILNRHLGTENKDGTWFSHRLYHSSYRWESWEHGEYKKQTDGTYRFVDKRSGATYTAKATESAVKDSVKKDTETVITPESVWSCLGCGKDEEGCTCEKTDQGTLIERAALLLNVSPDDLRAWGYDDPVLLQEIATGWDVDGDTGWGATLLSRPGRQRK